jgi:cell division protein FtsZ
MLKKVDDVLFHAVKGISELITKPGYISLDFADVRTAMGDAGLAMMGTGIAKGEARAREAALQAISSPLLEDVSIDGARHVLMNVTADKNIQLDEVTEAANIVTEGTHHDQAYVFFGMVIDEAMGDEMRITVIATGIDRTQEKILEVGQAAHAPEEDRFIFDDDDADIADIPTFPIKRRWDLCATGRKTKEPKTSKAHVTRISDRAE